MKYIFDVLNYMEHEYDYIDSYHAQLTGCRLDEGMRTVLEALDNYDIEFIKQHEKIGSSFVVVLFTEIDCVFFKLKYGSGIEYIGEFGLDEFGTCSMK